MMTEPDSHVKLPAKKRVIRILSSVAFGLTLLLLIGLSICFAKQFDACTAITVYPSWVWFLCGLILSLTLVKTGSRRAAFLTCCLWGLFLVGFADAPLSLCRGIWGSSNTEWIAAQIQQQSLRVISLNCSGSKKSILALKQAKPDLILIQESPGLENLKTVADEVFGTEGNFLVSVDAAILCQGEVEQIAAAENWLVGKTTLPTGQEIVVASLRLSTPPFRFDLWNPGCWRTFRNNRIKQRNQLAELS
tara:strand:+ start:3280 stop:4023 length:744 start_codon:yes stop_codon:yes gene_type:complete